MLAVSMHLYANFRAVKSVVMATLNQVRFHIVTQEFLDNNQPLMGVMTPVAANPLEPVVWSEYFLCYAIIKGVYDPITFGFIQRNGVFGIR